MPVTDINFNGRCYCGDFRFQLTGEFRSVCFCHCRSCQIASGAPYVAWGTLNKSNFQVTHGKLVECNVTTGVTRGFCGKCGSSITYYHVERPEEIDISIVTLEDAADLKPEYHLWVSDKLPWVEISDGLPQYQGWRNQ